MIFRFINTPKRASQLLFINQQTRYRASYYGVNQILVPDVVFDYQPESFANSYNKKVLTKLIVRQKKIYFVSGFYLLVNSGKLLDGG